MSTTSPAASRIALGVEYDGSGFSGWQSQKTPGVQTIQENLQQALSTIADEPVVIHCAGRTDTGVHATGQVIHFDTGAERPLKAWVEGANCHLPPQIRITWAHQVSDTFNARFSATARTYRYLILNTPVKPAIARSALTWCRESLDHELMHQEAQSLLGERNFTSFRASACQSNTPFRFVEKISVERFNSIVCLEITANAFLYHMVRNIAGVLMSVGKGEEPPGWTARVLEAKDRTKAGVTAPPEGLYLVNVRYPQDFRLPVAEPGPVFLSAIQH